MENYQFENEVEPKNWKKYFKLKNLTFELISKSEYYIRN